MTTVSRRSIRARTRSRRGSKSGLKASARWPSAPATSGRRTRSEALVWRIDPGLKLPHKIPLDLGVSSVAAGAGGVWATNELAGLVYRIDPSTNKANVARRTDGPATVAVGGGAAWVSVAGPPPAGTALPTSVCNTDRVRRRGQPALPDRLRPPAEGLGQHRFHTPDGGGDPARPRAASLPGRRIHGRLPVLRRLHRPGRWVELDPLPLEREGLREKPRRDRHHRLLQLQLLEGRNPCSEPGRERAAGDDQPGEHVCGSHPPRPGRQHPGRPPASVPDGEAELRSDAGRHAHDRHGNGPVRKAERRQAALPVLERRPILCRIRRRGGTSSPVPGDPDRRRRSIRPGGTQLQSIRSRYRSDPRGRGRALGVPASPHPRTAA